MMKINSLEVAKQSLLENQKTGQALVTVIERVQGIESNMKDLYHNMEKTNAVTNKRLDYMNDNVNLTRGQTRRLQSVVASRSNVLAITWIEENHGYSEYGGKDYLSKKIGQFRSSIWTYLKDSFDAAVYTEIRRTDYEKAINVAQAIAISNIKSYRVSDRQKTLKVLNEWETRKGLPLTQPDD